MMHARRLIFLSMMIVIALLFMPEVKATHPKINDVTMLAETLDADTYLLYQASYGIEEISSSAYGFSIYHVPVWHIETLEAKGFVHNGVSEIYRPPFLPPSDSDPYLSEQYALSMMSIYEAWTQTTGSADIVIAIIDTGIDIDHEEFVNRISTLSYNARTKQSWVPGDPTYGQVIDDDNGHGTMVAGVIGANKDNSKGIAGIVQLSPLLVIKANNLDNPLTEVDESKQFDDASIIEAIHYAVDQGADVINLSLGGSYANPLTKAAVDRAHDAGIIIVGASGNDGNTTQYYPASFDGVLSVGALGEDKLIASYSNYNDAVDLAAPGTNIVTTLKDNAYGSASGTSLAAPQVAAIIALMKARFPDFSRTELMAQIFVSTEDLGTPGYDHYYGYGLLNADQALQVDYITVTFETNGGTAVAPMDVIKDRPFVTPTTSKTGYTFLGWYRDQALTQPFVSAEDTLSENATLYASYDINIYQLIFVTSGDPIASLLVTYQEIPTLEEATKTGHTFIGWYLDSAFNNPYLDTPVIDDMLLYAKFEPNIYQVTYYIDGNIDEVVDVTYGTFFDPKVPETEQPFLGWYLSPEFLIEYQGDIITSHLSLYARLDNGKFLVTYVAADLSTVILFEEVYVNSEVLPPDSPTKPSSPSFDYVFIGWSDTSDDVTQDMLIYPLYEAIYQSNSIQLNKGVDTVSSFDLWIDGSINITDEVLSYETTVQAMNATHYHVTYSIIYQNDVIDQKHRMVYVIPETTIIITLNPDVTTLLEGEPYQDAGATSNIGDIEIIGTVDPEIPGIYVIRYQVSYGDYIVRKSKYVYVLTSEELYQNRTIYYRREEEVAWR